MDDPQARARALCQAAASGDLDEMRELLSLGTGPTGRFELVRQAGRHDYTTPLHEAIRAGQLEATRMLIQYGAHANEMDGSQSTPLKTWLQARGTDILHKGALHAGDAPSESAWEIGVLLLEAGGHLGDPQLYALGGQTVEQYLQGRPDFLSLMQQLRARLGAKTLKDHTPPASNQRANRL